MILPRGCCVTRRSDAGTGHSWGATAAAVLYSFTGTCEHYYFDPFTHHKDVLRRLPSHPTHDLGEWLPDVSFASHPSSRRRTAA
jgi:hypothetical protein